MLLCFCINLVKLEKFDLGQNQNTFHFGRSDMSILAVFNVLDNECHVSWFDFDHPYWFFLSYLSYLFYLVYRVTFWFILWILLERSLQRNQKKYLLKNFRLSCTLCFLCVCAMTKADFLSTLIMKKLFLPLFC